MRDGKRIFDELLVVGCCFLRGAKLDGRVLKGPLYIGFDYLDIIQYATAWINNVQDTSWNRFIPMIGRPGWAYSVTSRSREATSVLIFRTVVPPKRAIPSCLCIMNPIVIVQKQS